LGMLGFPLLPVAEYPPPGKVVAAFFTMHALKDPALPQKLTGAVSAGVEILVTDGLKRSLEGVVQLDKPNVHVLPLAHAEPVRYLLDSPPQGIEQIRNAMLKALGWGLQLAQKVEYTSVLDWIGLYPFADGSWVVENFANETKEVSLMVPSADGSKRSRLMLKPRSWVYHWVNQSNVE